MTVYRNTEQWQEVLRVAREMKKQQLEWSRMAWNMVIQAHGRLKQGNEAYLTFQ